jgi:glucose-6-phosphate 1-dehydrogenase
MNTTQETFPDCDLVIYGGLGDLSRRKLLISLYRLEHGDFLEPGTRIIAVDRLEEDTESYIKIAYKSLIS